MMRRWLRLGFLAALAILASAQAVFAQAVTGTTGPATVRTERGPVVSLPVGGGIIWEAWATAPPDDPDRLMVCTSESGGEFGGTVSVAYVSKDGGNSWMRTLVDRASAWVTESSCAAGADGRAYFSASASDTSRGGLRHQGGTLETFRSLDGGLTWSGPQQYPFLDWTHLMAVPDAGENREKIYLFGNHLAQGFGGKGDGAWIEGQGPMSVSEDGLHFSVPKFPPEEGEKKRFGLFAMGSVQQTDGSLLVLYAKLGNPRSESDLVLYKSDANGYRSFSKIPLPPEMDKTALLGAQIAVDRSTHFANRLYVAFSNQWLGQPVLALATTDDGGATWGVRVLRRSEVLPNGEDPRGGFAGIAVNQDGVVGIEWQPTGECPTFLLSVDGGQSLGEDVTLGDCAGRRDRENLPRFAEGLQWTLSTKDGFSVMMHTTKLAFAQIVSDAEGRFHPFWAEVSREGRISFRTTTIRVPEGARTPRAVPNVNTLADLTPSTTIRVLEEHFDPYTGTFDIQITAQNALPQKRIAYPSFFQVRKVESDCGKVVYLNPTFATESEHPIYRIPGWTDTLELPPGGQTLPLHLMVQVVGCDNLQGQLVERARKEARDLAPEFAPLSIYFRVLGESPQRSVQP